MNNENYYKSELENLIDGFLGAESDDGDFGYLAPETASLMAEAAFCVLKNSVLCQKYAEDNNR